MVSTIILNNIYNFNKYNKNNFLYRIKQISLHKDIAIAVFFFQYYLLSLRACLNLF